MTPSQAKLIDQGFDILECPNCGKDCNPETKDTEDTVYYEFHECRSEYEIESWRRRFAIDANGDIIE